MAVKNEQIEKNLVKLTFEVSAEDFDKAINQVYKKNVKKFNVPGYRKGKAPRKIIEKYYTEAVFYDEAINSVLPQAYDEALKESGVESVARPEIDVEEIKKGEPVVFTALVTTKPEVKLGDYKGIEVEKIDHTVTDEDVDKDIEATQKKNARLITVDDRAIENGDIAVIDFEGFVDDVAFEGGKGEDYELEIGSGTFIPGFEDQLIGVNAEDDVEVNVVFPDEYYEEVAGKEARFEVHVSKVQAYDTSVWNDEYVKQNTDYESQEDMENSIRNDLESTAQSDATSNWEYDLIQEVLNGSEFQIEESDKDLYVDQMMSEYESYAAAANMELDDYLSTYLGTTEAQLREFFRTTAEFRVKMTLVFHEIAQQEGITVSDQEYEDRLNELAKQYNYENTDDIVSLYSEEMIREEIVQEKVISLIEENAVQPE